jgi:hypothetical protein
MPRRLIVGFFDGADQPHLDEMQHAPINDPARYRQLGMCFTGASCACPLDIGVPA